jgi:nucleoside-diphosphate-sugar epimerase
VLLVDPDPGLGGALAAALARLGTEVHWWGAAPAPEVRGIRPVPEPPRASAADAAAWGEIDAAVDFGARGAEAPLQLARRLRGRVGLVVQIGSWRVYAGADDVPEADDPGAGPGITAWRGLPPLPLDERAPKQDGPALAAEDGLWQARSLGDYPATLLRLAAPYGPGVGLAREWFVVQRLRAGRRRLALWDGGPQLLHRVYVDNAVHAILGLLEHPREADGHAFHVGDRHVPTAAALCAGIAASAGRPLEAVPVPAALRPPVHPWAAPRPVVLDLCQLRARLGYTEPVSADEALARTVRWLWDLPEQEVPLRLAAYLRRFGAAHDVEAEDAALLRWARCGGSPAAG